MKIPVWNYVKSLIPMYRVTTILTYNYITILEIAKLWNTIINHCLQVSGKEVGRAMYGDWEATSIQWMGLL